MILGRSALGTLRSILGSLFPPASVGAGTAPRVVTANAWACSTVEASGWANRVQTDSAWPNVVVSANAVEGA